jgi:hypothetical protein
MSVLKPQKSSFAINKIATKHKVFAAISLCIQKLLTTLLALLWHLKEEKATIIPVFLQPNV